MTAGRADIVVEQGSDFLKIIDVNLSSGTPVDLTDFTFLCAMRQTPEDTLPILTFTCTQDNVVSNRLSVSALAADTADIPDTVSTVCFWDLQMVSPDMTPINTRLLEGIARFVPRISQ